MISDRKRKMLQVLAQGPRGEKFFSHAEGGGLAPHVVASYLRQIEELGYVEEIGLHWRITDAGRKALESDQRETVTSRYYGNASTPPGSYTPPRWAVREGADQHLKCRSISFGALEAGGANARHGGCADGARAPAPLAAGAMA